MIRYNKYYRFQRGFPEIPKTPPLRPCHQPSFHLSDVRSLYPLTDHTCTLTLHTSTSTHSHSTCSNSTHHTPHSHSTHHTLHTLHTLTLHTLTQESEANNGIPEFEGDTSQSQRSRTPSPLPEGKEKDREKGGRDNGTVNIHLLFVLWSVFPPHTW